MGICFAGGASTSERLALCVVTVVVIGREQIVLRIAFRFRKELFRTIRWLSKRAHQTVCAAAVVLSGMVDALHFQEVACHLKTLCLAIDFDRVTAKQVSCHSKQLVASVMNWQSSHMINCCHHSTVTRDNMTQCLHEEGAANRFRLWSLFVFRACCQVMVADVLVAFPSEDLGKNKHLFAIVCVDCHCLLSPRPEADIVSAEHGFNQKHN